MESVEFPVAWYLWWFGQFSKLVNFEDCLNVIQWLLLNHHHDCRFDFSALNEENGQQRILAEEQENMIISNLHKILKPFVLRRLKTDGNYFLTLISMHDSPVNNIIWIVENALPKKKEYLLFAPISAQQKALYDAVLRRDLRQYLVKMTTGKSPKDSSEPMDIHEGK